MNFKRLLILSLFCVFVLESYAQKWVGEVINGPANIRDSVSGKIYFSLNDSVFVDNSDLNNNWLVVGLMIKPTDVQLKKGIIEIGEKLLDASNDTIGIAISEIPLGSFPLTSEKDSITYEYLIGYTYKNNIKLESLLENILISYLKINLKYGNYFELKSFIELNEFELMEPQTKIQDYKMYYLLEAGLIDSQSPPIRAGLIFEKDTLVGIIHSRKITFDNMTDYKVIYPGESCSIFNKNSDKKEKILEYVTEIYRNWAE